MTTALKLFLAVCVLAGAAFGLLANHLGRVSAAPASYYVWVHPGGTSPDGVNDYLNCGWHSVCLDPFAWGTSLDWQNAHGENVYYRSRSYNSAGNTWAGRALITDLGGTCRVTNVSQYRRSGAHDSTVKFVHTGSNYHGAQFYINSSNWSPGPWTSYVVGNTLNEAGLGCQTTGAHLHEEVGFGQNYWINPTGSFPNAGGEGGCNTGCGNKLIFQLYQLGFYWSE